MSRRVKSIMVSDNKIVTVTYGAFSCSLEGYEDPLPALRSIAKYLQELTQQDRQFGAPAPTSNWHAQPTPMSQEEPRNVAMTCAPQNAAPTGNKSQQAQPDTPKTSRSKAASRAAKLAAMTSISPASPTDLSPTDSHSDLSHVESNIQLEATKAVSKPNTVSLHSNATTSQGPLSAIEKLERMRAATQPNTSEAANNMHISPAWNTAQSQTNTFEEEAIISTGLLATSSTAPFSSTAPLPIVASSSIEVTNKPVEYETPSEQTCEDEMGKGDRKRRRNAIQHLKAVVFSKRAEKIKPADPSKQDLNQSVPSRLAPLILVAEQRVDLPRSEDTPSSTR